MRVPISWLRQWADVPADATGEQVAAALVRVGLEEEGLHGGDVTGPVVVGRVLTADPEPQRNGKTIRWCTVDVGDGGPGAGAVGAPRGIVCGAPNVGPGDLVVVALPGAVLPGPFPIAARRTYGHVSDGMLCSARELGLGDDHAGIIVLDRLLGPAVALSVRPGDDALELLGLTEEVVEVNVTPDRGYCFSVRGLAREYVHGAGLDVATSFRDPADVEVPAAGTASGTAAGHSVELRDSAPLHGQPGCTRFVTRVVRGVDPGAPSPWWLQRRLQQAGMRPISLAVDVTNHVMLELGQPLHAYDLGCVDGPLVVRRARAGERIVTLDGVERTLDPEDLLVADGPDGERALGIAGVMGGRATEVTTSTRDVLVEAARFDPVTVARSARRHRLPSEASRRFERGVDPALQAVAAELVVRLLVEHGGGTADDGVSDVVAPGAPLEPAAVDLPADLPARLSGIPASVMAPARVSALLEQVGCTVTSVAPAATSAAGVLRVQPPTWRPDITQPVDLVEEVVRLHGYDQVPVLLPPAPPGRGLTPAQRARRRVADALAAAGLVEVRSYPFTSPGRSDELGLPADDPRRTALRLANPLSREQPLLRTSVLATLVDVLRRNTSRGAADVAVFELGSVTLPAPGPLAPAPRPGVDRRPGDDELASLLAAVPAQPLHLAGLLSGRAEPEGWWGPGRAASAADAVAAAQTVAGTLRVGLVVTAGALAPWHPGRCARLALPDGTPVGHAGELAPAVVAALGLPARTVAFELDLDALVAAAPDLVPAPRLSAFPPSKEDVALVVEAAVPAESVRRALLGGAAVAAAQAGLEVEEVRLFDVYSGPPVPDGHRSLAFSLRLRAQDRTLTAADAAAVREAAVAEAARRLGAVLRGA